MSVITVTGSNTFEEWRKKTNDISSILGDSWQLPIGQTTAIRAISSNTFDIGILSALTTTEKGNLVDAINEVDNHIDNIDIDIGDISLLLTTDKSSVVNAINELKLFEDDVTNGFNYFFDSLDVLHDKVVDNTDSIDDLYDYMIYEMDYMYNHILDVETIATDNQTNIGDMSLDGGMTNLTDAVNQSYNEVISNNDDIGDLTLLTTTVSTSLVDAINEVDAHDQSEEIGDLSLLDTGNKTNLVNAINEVSTNTIAMALLLG